MRKWSDFGDQVNRLVYTLAACKFQANIEGANRFIAEQIFYSEVSVRMMRQGRFRPQEEKALEILAEIGHSQAGLEREWASRLLHTGGHSKPEAVLQRIYPPRPSGSPTTPPPASYPPQPAFAIRMVCGIVASIGALLVWAYFINPVYPAPHELPLLKESIWGFLIGMGLIGGVIAADILSGKMTFFELKKGWLRCLYLPVAGFVGGLLWNWTALNYFAHSPSSILMSTGFETFSFGAVYGLAFGAGSFVSFGNVRGSDRWLEALAYVLIFAAVTGSLSWGGYTLAKVQPSFANQKDIDLFVGIFLRVGLVLTVSKLFPLISSPTHPSGTFSQIHFLHG